MATPETLRELASISDDWNYIANDEPLGKQLLVHADAWATDKKRLEAAHRDIPHQDGEGEWEVVMGEETDDMGGTISTYVVGIEDASGFWIVKFEDDYGNDQLANAKRIVALHNAALALEHPVDTHVDNSGHSLT